MLEGNRLLSTSPPHQNEAQSKPWWFRSSTRWVLLLSVLLVFLQYQLWWSQGGLMQTYNLRQQLHEQQHTNMMIQQRNQKIRHQIQLWQHSDSTVETLARQELGMIKPGEHYYQF